MLFHWNWDLLVSLVHFHVLFSFFLFFFSYPYSYFSSLVEFLSPHLWGNNFYCLKQIAMYIYTKKKKKKVGRVHFYFCARPLYDTASLVRKDGNTFSATLHFLQKPRITVGEFVGTFHWAPALSFFRIYPCFKDIFNGAVIDYCKKSISRLTQISEIMESIFSARNNRLIDYFWTFSSQVAWNVFLTSHPQGFDTSHH